MRFTLSEFIPLMALAAAFASANGTARGEIGLWRRNFWPRSWKQPQEWFNLHGSERVMWSNASLECLKEGWA